MDFNKLPEAVSGIQNQLTRIEELLTGRIDEKQTEADHWFNIDELCKYHPDKPSKATVYGWVSHDRIPVHKGGKKLRFLKSEIDKWLLQGRKKTVADFEKDADAYLTGKKKGGKI